MEKQEETAKMGCIDKIFSKQHMLAYSGACIDMAKDMAEARSKRFSFDTLMIPSRGAFPFFLGMTYALKKLGTDFGDEFDKLYRGLAIPQMLAPLMPANSEISTDLQNKDVRVLLIPFTADLNIPKFDSRADNDEYTRKTREYWARVTESFLRSTKFRAANPYFGTFVDIILKDIERRQEVAEAYEKFPPITNFATIDTVISGRASNEILQAFDDIAKERHSMGVGGPDDVKPRAFLIVDDNGKKLRHKFKEYLQGKSRAGYASMYQIPRIVSEDENAALLGVSAVTYPSIMRASRDFMYRGREFFIGAGSWHINPKSPSMLNFQKFMDLVYAGIDAVYDKSYKGDEKSLEKFAEERAKFAENANSTGLLSLKDSEISLRDHVRDRVLNPEDIYETGSHVLHVPFSDNVTNNLAAKICRTYGPYGVYCAKKKDEDTEIKKQNVRAAIRGRLPIRLS